MATDAALGLVVNRIDSSGGNAERTGSATLAAEGATAEWPTLAVLPPDKIGVTWIQPRPGGGNEAHFARYKICTGSP